MQDTEAEEEEVVDVGQLNHKGTPPSTTKDDAVQEEDCNQPLDIQLSLVKDLKAQQLWTAKKTSQQIPIQNDL